MAAYVELYIDQGANFRNVINLTDDVTNSVISLATYNVRSQIRRSYYPINASATIGCTITDSSNGDITMSLDSANTYSIKAGRSQFDLETVDGNGYVNRVLEGIITVTPQVTR